MKKYLLTPTVIIMFFSSVSYFAHSNNKEFNDKLKSGEIQIQCNIDGVMETIDNEKIVSYDRDLHYAEFTNGYSNNCEVIK